MRLFLAIFPPKEIRDSFKEIQTKLSKFDKYLRFVKEDQIHLSLRFLGSNVSEESFDKLLPILKGLKFEGFNARIKEARFGFPGRRWPRILYVSLMRNEALDKITSELKSQIDALDLEDIQEERHGSPLYHFTLARVKARLDKSIVFDIRRKLENIHLWEGFRVDEIKLIKSELTKEGPKYEEVETKELGTRGFSPLYKENKTRGFNPLKLKEEVKDDKYPNPYLVTWVTHNSRVSERMIKFGIQKSAPVILSRQNEIEITGFIRDIVKKNKIKVLAYNICKDHIHMVIVCYHDDLVEIVRKLKGGTAYMFNCTKCKSSVNKNSLKLWAQKFNRRELDGDDSLANAIDYVERNREYHSLPYNAELERIKKEFIINEEVAFDG